MKYRSLTVLALFLATYVNAQKTTTPAPAAKVDVVLKVNGDELSGKVLEISDSEVKFSYVGETLIYTFKRADILKITYASGRIEYFNKQPLPSESNPSTTNPGNNSLADSTSSLPKGDHHNKLAILPFGFVRDGQNAADELSFKVQNECYSILGSKAPMLAILDPRTSNAMLMKAGITKETIKGYTSADLCNILGVEYVVDGTVMLDRTTQTTSGSTNYQSSSSSDYGKGKDKYSASSSSTSTNYQNYQTTISLSIYNDKGTSVFSQNRKSFWTDQNAYKNALEYLLKKTPFYQK